MEHREGFRHDALFYEGVDGFLDAVVPFIKEAVESREPVLVAVTPEKIERIESALHGGAEAVRFANIRDLGHNPARILPAWRDFVAENRGAGTYFRGVDEPIWPGRSEPELAECHLHERLLNMAFHDGPAWWLVCPYDTSALAPDVIVEARRTHPRVIEGGEVRPAAGAMAGSLAGRFDAPFPSPPARAQAIAFDLFSLVKVRSFVAERAEHAGLDFNRAEELVLAVNEAATNSIRHGGGRGTLWIWTEDGVLLCELRDSGRIDDPLVGRETPTLEQIRGRGLWLANQLCDLVQVRSDRDGVTVRLHMAIA